MVPELRAWIELTKGGEEKNEPELITEAVYRPSNRKVITPRGEPKLLPIFFRRHLVLLISERSKRSK